MNRIKVQKFILSIVCLSLFGVGSLFSLESHSSEVNQAGALYDAAGALNSGANKEQNMAMQMMMTAMQLEAAASALEPCEKTQKKKKLFGLLGSKKKKVTDEECEATVSKLRDLARQMMMMAMQHKASGDEMAKKGKEAAEAGDMQAAQEAEDKAAQERLDKVENLREEIAALRDKLEEADGLNASNGASASACDGCEPGIDAGIGADLPKLTYLYEGKLGEKLAWFEEAFGVSRENLVKTVFEGGSIGELLEGKGAFAGLSAATIDEAIANHSHGDDIITLLAAMEQIAADVADGKIDGVIPGDITNDKPVVHAHTNGVKQENGAVFGGIAAKPASGNSSATCETHFEVKPTPTGLTGYVVSVCEDSVHPGAISIKTSASGAEKSNSPLANAPHNAHAGYEQWQLKGCNYIYRPGEKSLVVDACRPNQMGSIVIDGKTHTGPFFFSIEPLAEDVFSRVTFEEVTVWASRDNGITQQVESLSLAQALNYVGAETIAQSN